MAMKECCYSWLWFLSYTDNMLEESLKSLQRLRNQKMRICASSSSEDFTVPAACSSFYVCFETIVLDTELHSTLLDRGFGISDRAI